MNLSNNSNNNNSNINALLNENNYYFKLFQNILESIITIYNTSSKSFTCQIHFLIAKTLQKIIKFIFKFYKPFSRTDKDKRDKLYDDIFNIYLIHIIKSDKIGNHIKLEYINVIPYLILYGKNRQNYYNFIEDEIFKSNNFFTKRCSINFIEKCLSLYSFKLFKKFNFIQLIYYLIYDENNIISTSILEKIFLFHKKLKLYSNNEFDKICSILLEIKNMNVNSSSTKNFDIEKNRIIKKILNLSNIKKNKKEINKNYFDNEDEEKDSEDEKELKQIKEKELTNIKKENEIFGKNYQTISLFITMNSNKNNDNREKKYYNENKNEKSNFINNDEINPNYKNQNEKNKGRKMILDKSTSDILQGINSKTATKKYLPKLKKFFRKNSCNNNRPNNLNLFANNIINENLNQINNKSINLNKLMIIIQERTPEKKNNLRAINNKLPSAKHNIMKDLNRSNSLNLKPKNLFLIQNKLDNNICLYDPNFKVIHLDELNKSNILHNIIRYSGNDIFKEIIKNDIDNNQEKKENKLNNSCKKVSNFLKQKIKGIKIKRESYFNSTHKISLNSKMFEINKSNK